MKIVYIAHPIGGDVVANLARLREIIREINLTEPDVVPFAPYYSDCLALDDSNPFERVRGIKNNSEIINRNLCDELRLYGNRISPGMLGEIKRFRLIGKPIVAMTDETIRDFVALSSPGKPYMSPSKFPRSWDENHPDFNPIIEVPKVLKISALVVIVIIISLYIYLK